MSPIDGTDEYNSPHFFGEPYPALKAFFRDYPFRCTVLDLGCGQGRDALYLAQLGYKVIGVDQSTLGLKQMMAEAKTKHLNIIAKTADMYTYPIDQQIDIILLDSVLNYFNTAFITRLANELKVGGIIANFMFQDEENEKKLKHVLPFANSNWECLSDLYIDYPDMPPDDDLKDTNIHMYIVRKIAAK